MAIKLTRPGHEDAQADLRHAFRLANRRRHQAEAQLLAAGVPCYELAIHLRQEDWSLFTDLRCGAKTRSGTPCKQRGLYACGRCRLHGGLSTGPKSPEGKYRAALNGLSPKRTP